MGVISLARPRKKSLYDADHLQNELMDMVVEVFLKSGQEPRNRNIEAVAQELSMSRLKVRKLLITAGERDQCQYYTNEACNQVLELHRQGKTVQQICEITGLGRASVHGYLPYSKTIYNLKELSTDAERVKRFRDRKEHCSQFNNMVLSTPMQEVEPILWELLKEMSVCVYQTFSGLSFKYCIRGGEMFVDRKEKSITKATVMLAFQKALHIQQEQGFVSGP